MLYDKIITAIPLEYIESKTTVTPVPNEKFREILK